ncbi:hypothetical protein BO70DRAFT_364394 [Aspergillus heteromorphus CBS 117.55]|uniref:DUF7514 domain-containing protein n=1 Tax=Aspergillus heteromorphus CBS 117.55 TaxID=1448321 RepID=A0A317VLI3_9EURO|nr:uncharacterized protein BO70DRAFT_364394 [Aspergillus heteromorphus CBS 117.55]PWY74429.1 hypothetical protein BO70DRAFT_364394 [Aspergillus heteromorphus CBS 117.55]
MAYNSFSNSPSTYSQFNPNENRASSYTPPYPSQYGSDQLSMPQASAPPPSSSPAGYYPQPSYEAAPWQQQQQQQPPPPPTGRINEAVNSAFHQADSPAYLSPEVVSQITATVIQQLKATGLDNIPSDQQLSPQPPPTQWAPQATAPMHGESLYSPMRPQASPPPPPKIPQDNVEYQPPVPPPVHPSSPHLFPGPSVGHAEERRGSPASQASCHSQNMESRPKPPSREATVTEMTTLEKIWGKLFEDGKPTERLGQFLRGIAVHLIENYAPGNTLVVTPDKLQKFYEDTSVSSDPYPWKDIFDDRTSSISRLYREVEAEHHLVQNKLDERPDIPGLTPRGFERWATLMIQAHPEKEYERLQKAVLNMPISNPDNRKERFPKEIPRRLFPDTPILSVREDVDQFIIKHCGVDLPPITEEDLKQVAAKRHKQSVHKASVSSVDSTRSMGERDRQPYYSGSSSAVVDDDDKEIPSRPIERQRKPYSAQVGGGKVYDEAGSSSHRHAASTTGSAPHDSPTLSASRVPETYSHDPHHIRTGTGGSQRPTTTFGRSRSPVRGFNTGGDYRHSESDLLGHGSSSRYPGLSDGDYYSSAVSPGDIIEDRRRHYTLDHKSDEPRLYDSFHDRDKERKRSSWGGDEDYYRGAIGSGSGSGSTGHDYKTYGYR